MADWVSAGGSEMVANMGPFLGQLPLEFPTYYPIDVDPSVTTVTWLVTSDDGLTYDNYTATYLSGSEGQFSGAYSGGVVGTPMTFYVGVNNGTGLSWEPALSPESVTPPAYAAGGTAPNPSVPTPPIISPDNFADRQVLSRGVPSSFGTFGSTLEVGEEDGFFGEGGSVWFQITSVSKYGPWVDVTTSKAVAGKLRVFTDYGTGVTNPTMEQLMTQFPAGQEEFDAGIETRTVSLGGQPGWVFWIQIQSKSTEQFEGTLEWYHGEPGPWEDTEVQRSVASCEWRIFRDWQRDGGNDPTNPSCSHDSPVYNQHYQYTEPVTFGSGSFEVFYRSHRRTYTHTGTSGSHRQEVGGCIYVWHANSFLPVGPSAPDPLRLGWEPEAEQGWPLPGVSAGILNAVIRGGGEPGSSAHQLGRAPMGSYTLIPDALDNEIKSPAWDGTTDDPWWPPQGFSPPPTEDDIFTYMTDAWLTTNATDNVTIVAQDVGPWDIHPNGDAVVAIWLAPVFRSAPPAPALLGDIEGAEPATMARLEHPQAFDKLTRIPPPIGISYQPPRVRGIYREKRTKKPLRQRQRGDGLAISPQRMFQGPSNQVSKQSARRQGWNNTFL